MTVPWSPVQHCPRCGVQWETPQGTVRGCWLCGQPGVDGIDRSVPWTSSARYEARREREAS